MCGENAVESQILIDAEGKLQQFETLAAEAGATAEEIRELPKALEEAVKIGAVGGGFWAGAQVGSFLGTIIPGFGNAIGFIIGGAIGAVLVEAINWIKGLFGGEDEKAKKEKEIKKYVKEANKAAEERHVRRMERLAERAYADHTLGMNHPDRVKVVKNLSRPGQPIEYGDASGLRPANSLEAFHAWLYWHVHLADVDKFPPGTVPYPDGQLKGRPSRALFLENLRIEWEASFAAWYRGLSEEDLERLWNEYEEDHFRRHGKYVSEWTPTPGAGEAPRPAEAAREVEIPRKDPYGEREGGLGLPLALVAAYLVSR